MERLFLMGRLLDYYGDFLTDRQKKLLTAYAVENLSLAEIAEREGISRQGVRDGLVRAERQLTEMEERLGLADKAAKLDAQLKRVEDLSETFDLTETQRDALNAALREVYTIWEDGNGI